uniref:platelet endothelial cell adhesion molecule isoform X5 n=1 Tax=Nyctereutes procyonoides TaxID=34880 RepID=UPI002444E54B|nr:platelet endothelial cell adhesion molecule isoform X5 [Nyctereutes procyonoides]
MPSSQRAKSSVSWWLNPCACQLVNLTGTWMQGGFIWATWEVPSAPGAWPKGRTNCPKFTLKMQLEWTQEGKMWLGALLILLLCPSLEGQENSFTINHIHMEILPGEEVQNGENMTLQCIVDISTTSHIKPQHWVLFYKDDVLFHNVSSVENTESYFIPRARVYDAGTYKCTVILNNKEKTTSEYQVWVKGVSDPIVTLDKKEAIEGGVVKVNCSVPEEKPPIYFTIEKLRLDTKGFKQKREKTSRNQNFMMLEFTVEEQDHVIFFQCQARIISGTHMETSRAIKSELVTVTESFSNPKFHVSPEGVITEGDQLYIRCTIQVTHLVQAFPEIIIQKDKAIVAHKRHGNEATYSVMAMAEHNGNYTCKVEASRISKVSSIVVNITELFSKPKLGSSTTRLDQGESLNLWCSIPEAPPANFTIQKENTIVSQSQNFTKIASATDSGTYTCNASMGKVVKRSSAVQITVCEMLSKPRIFYDSSSEVIKGQTIAVSCQSINGTTPISYHLLKTSNILESRDMSSNEPAVFKDNPTKDTEYQCIVDNCHSHSEMVSEVLRVKVIAPVDEVKLSILMNAEVEFGKDIGLLCSVNEATGPITYRFYKEAGSLFYQTTSNETHAVWYKSKASKEHEGQYYCTASNRANRLKSSPQSNVLTVRVFLAAWIKGLIAVVVIGVIIGVLILGARCYILKKAKAKQTPVEMSRPAVPLLNSTNEKMLSDPNTEVNRHYGYNEDVGNHAMKPINENKGLETKGTETVYSEIRKANPENGRLP